jgi:DNA-binding transcriptional LysR family regulator
LLRSREQSREQLKGIAPQALHSTPYVREGHGRPMIAPLPWDLVTAFLVLAEELQFASAAERLGISRQALSRRISRLEAHADSRLIQRSTRRVDLTPAGAVLREHAVPIAEAMGQMAEQVRQVNSNRPLSVGISTDLTAPWTTLVEGWINARGAPAVLERRPSRDAIRLARDGSLDLVVLVGEFPDEPHSTIVGHEPTVVLFPDTHPAARQSTIRAGDLRDLVVAVSDAGTIEPRALVRQLHGDPELPYLLAPRVGTIASGLAHAVRTHGAATVVVAGGVAPVDTTGLVALPMDPPFPIAVTVVARPGLADEPYRSLVDHLLSAPLPDSAAS